MGLIDGLKNIANGVITFGKGVLQVVLGAFKLALAAVVLTIYGIYKIAEGIFNFAKNSYKKLKERRPNTKPKGAGSITGKKLGEAIKNAGQQIGQDIDLSEFDKDEAINELNDIARKLESGEIDGMQYLDGKNEEGDDDILDAQFLKATEIDSDSKDSNVYRNFKNA